MANNFVVVAVFLVAMSTTATVTEAQQPATCAQKLVSCYPYIHNATIKPRDDCCNPIKEAVATELPCLCNLYKDPKVFASFRINNTDALRVTRDCGVSTDLSNCNNSTSPTSATPPPGGRAAGQNGGGAGRIPLSGGVTMLLIFLTSISLYY